MKKALGFAIVIALAACGGKKQAGDTGGSGSAAGSAGSAMAGSGSADTGSGSGSGSAAMAGSGSGSAAVAGPVDVPTEEDFEDDAAQKITEANVDDSVKQIEQDLNIAP